MYKWNARVMCVHVLLSRLIHLDKLTYGLAILYRMNTRRMNYFEVFTFSRTWFCKGKQRTYPLVWNVLLI